MVVFVSVSIGSFFDSGVGDSYEEPTKQAGWTGKPA